MKTQHTPGPWEVRGQAIRKGEGVIARAYANRAVTADGHEHCSSRLISAAEADRNARLIAAAPELLAALELARDELQLVSDENGGSHGKPLDVILSAIAKATGVTP